MRPHRRAGRRPVAIEPEQRAREQEVGHLRAPVIVDQSIPIDVPRLLGIGVLVERGAVETREAVRIVRKMAGYPIEDHAKPGAMAGIDQRCEIGGASETAGRREHAGRLIAPGAVKRMLGDRHKFDMGEIEIAHIGRQLVRQFAIGQPAMALVGSPPPRAEMHLIDRDRRFARVAAGRRRRRAIDRRRFDDDRCRLWAAARRQTPPDRI